MCRRNQIGDQGWDANAKIDHIAGVQLTKAPKFIDKVLNNPPRTFIVGTDTINRISELKYYENQAELDDTIKTFIARGTKFLVFKRLGQTDNREATQKACGYLDYTLSRMNELCTDVSEEDFPPLDISSTAIRHKRNQQI